MPAESRSHAVPSLRSTGIWLVVLTSLLVLFWLVILVMVPAQKKQYDLYGLQIPATTMLAIRITSLVRDFWLVLLPMSVLTVLSGVVLGRHVIPSPRIGTMFAALVAVAILGSIGIVMICLAIPAMKLAEGLSK